MATHTIIEGIIKNGIMPEHTNIEQDPTYSVIKPLSLDACYFDDPAQ